MGDAEAEQGPPIARQPAEPRGHVSQVLGLCSAASAPSWPWSRPRPPKSRAPVCAGLRSSVVSRAFFVLSRPGGPGLLCFRDDAKGRLLQGIAFEANPELFLLAGPEELQRAMPGRTAITSDRSIALHVGTLSGS